MKQLSYYSIDRNHCISSPIKSKRFSTAKGRLDFDGSEMAPSDILTSEQDMNAPGPNSVTSVKSVTKCIKVSSPVPIWLSMFLSFSLKVLLPGEEFLTKNLQLNEASFLLFSREESLHSSSMKSKRCSTAKGRLAFDGSEMTPSDIPTSDENENTTGSPSEDDTFDFDLPNLDCLADFRFSKILLYVFCLTWFLTGVAGPYSVTSVKSVTKCIKVFSPIKSRKSTRSGHKTCDADQVVDYIANMVHV
ncbi:hypothetical protein Tco_0581299 [Tanacetum coccineum]